VRCLGWKVDLTVGLRRPVLVGPGEKLVNFLVEPKMGTKWPKNLPRFENRQDAIAVCKDLCTQQFLLRCEKRGKGELGMMRVRDFDESGYFAWLYEGNKTMTHLMTAGLVMGFLCCVCFPIWPSFLKVFVWYMSVSLLLFIFFLITSRAVLFLVVWVVGWEMWFLPNLFDESLGFVDSFKPVISIESTKPGQLPYRLGVGLAVGSFCYWAVTQPSEFDGVVKAQGDFLKDLYAGTLLSDVSQEQKENIDKPKMQSLHDLLKSLDKEIEENIQTNDDLDDEDKLDSMLDNLIEDEENIDEDDEDLN
jgi:translocation protein SEC62